MKMYHASSFALAGLVPAAAIAPGGQAAIDLALGVAMPVHSHVAMNFVRDSMRWRRETTGDGRRSSDARRGVERDARAAKISPRRVERSRACARSTATR